MNLRYTYKSYADDFCNEFYATYDTNFDNLVSYYKPESLITYLGEEFLGFEGLHHKILNCYFIQRFEHLITSIEAQPMGIRSLLITVHGNVKGIVVNDISSCYQSHPFTETFVVHLSERITSINTGKYLISNNVFTLKN